MNIAELTVLIKKYDDLIAERMAIKERGIALAIPVHGMVGRSFLFKGKLCNGAKVLTEASEREQARYQEDLNRRIVELEMVFADLGISL